MVNEEFISLVKEHGQFASMDDAERAIQAILGELGSHLSIGEAQDLAEELPPKIGNYLLEKNNAEAFGLDELLRRISMRIGYSVEDAASNTRAILSVLVQSVSPL